MSTEKEKEVAVTGKVSTRKKKVIANLDLSDLDYLEHRDIGRVAKEVGVRADYVSKVKRGESYSVSVLAALLKRARENKQKLVA